MLTRLGRCWLAACSAVLSAGSAFADESVVGARGADHSTPAPAKTTWQDTAQPPDEADREPATSWYGWQILISDAASMAALGAAAGSDSPMNAGLLLLAIGGYLVPPPIIHGMHDQGGRSLLSVGMRLGLPVLGAAVAEGASSGCEGVDCSGDAALVGLLLGAGAALALDVALANEAVKPARTTPGVALAPQLIISERETRFGITGSF